MSKSNLRKAIHFLQQDARLNDSWDYAKPLDLLVDEFKKRGNDEQE